MSLHLPVSLCLSPEALLLAALIRSHSLYGPPRSEDPHVCEFMGGSLKQQPLWIEPSSMVH